MLCPHAKLSEEHRRSDSSRQIYQYFGKLFAKFLGFVKWHPTCLWPELFGKSVVNKGQAGLQYANMGFLVFLALNSLP